MVPSLEVDVVGSPDGRVDLRIDLAARRCEDTVLPRNRPVKQLRASGLDPFLGAHPVADRRIDVFRLHQRHML